VEVVRQKASSSPYQQEIGLGHKERTWMKASFRPWSEPLGDKQLRPLPRGSFNGDDQGRSIRTLNSEVIMETRVFNQSGVDRRDLADGAADRVFTAPNPKGDHGSVWITSDIRIYFLRY
jgi:hypothetical protein